MHPHRKADARLAGNVNGARLLESTLFRRGADAPKRHRGRKGVVELARPALLRLAVRAGLDVRREVVVAGTAKVTRGKEEVVLFEDQSTYIPMGTPHRLENPGKIPLHLIEVQSGSYLGEDDIVRFEDTYGRS